MIQSVFEDMILETELFLQKSRRRIRCNGCLSSSIIDSLYLGECSPEFRIDVDFKERGNGWSGDILYSGIHIRCG
jgi:hypothetical protein